jgi:hypothetical protein
MSPTNQVPLLTLAMESGCHYEDCQSETILFGGDCREWFCKEHFGEHGAYPSAEGQSHLPGVRGALTRAG